MTYSKIPALLALLLTSLATAACSDDPADDDAADGGVCVEGEHATLILQVDGLPVGVGGAVAVDGPTRDTSFASSATLDDNLSGQYHITAKRVTGADPTVRTVYEPTVQDGGAFCLAPEESHTTSVHYAAIPTSGALWLTQSNAAAGALASVQSASLRGSGEVPVAAQQSTVGRAAAFDRDGNLWSAGGTTADAPIGRYPAGALAAPDVKLAVDFGGCSPAISDLAFDRNGNLWVASPCTQSVRRLAAASLATSGAPAFDVTLTGSFAAGVNGLAFDAAGGLWVTSGTTIYGFDAAGIEAGTAGAPARTVSAQREGAAPLAADHVAFDAAGNAWFSDFAGGGVFELTAAQLAGSEAVVAPNVSIVLAVDVLLTSLAFDEGGGLWIPYGHGSIGRLGSAQLTTSSTAGQPTMPGTVLTSASFSDTEWLGFYPAPASSPLYAAKPVY